MTAIPAIFHGHTADEVLPAIAGAILAYGEETSSRNGPVSELLNARVVLTDPTKREILTVGRKANVFAQIAETVWVLAGRDDIVWLSEYLPRAPDFSDDGYTWSGAYGPRIRRMRGVDQLDYVVELLRRDHLTRQAVIQIYDADYDTLPELKDRPCNTQLQFQSRLGKLHLTVTVRSNDLMWGWSGVNTFEWSTLQEIVAQMLGIEVGPLTFNIGNLHLYGQHWAKARRLGVPSSLEGFALPGPRFDPMRTIQTVSQLDDLLNEWFVWEEACRMGWPKLLNIQEPLFRSWALAIGYYWSGEPYWLDEIGPTRLALAIAESPRTAPKTAPTASFEAPLVLVPTGHPEERVRAFLGYVTDLHATKHASYGDSWKKRGEQLSILANIARKVDRLGQNDEFESSADTALDLWVYLNKYVCWLAGLPSDPEHVDPLLEDQISNGFMAESWQQRELGIVADFERYLLNMEGLFPESKALLIMELAQAVAPLARDLWLAEYAAPKNGDAF